MTQSLLEEHADDLRTRVASLASGLADGTARDELCAAAHKLRGSALVLGLDGLAVATAAYEEALTGRADEAAARRAALLALEELSRALEPDQLKPLRHDLRNDLNVVLMGSKLLEDELEDPDLRELARSIATAAERMTARLVELRSVDPAEAPHVQPQAAAAALSVLVVDDDELVAGVVQRMLDAVGGRIDVAPGLAAARIALAEHDYGAVVVDLRLDDGHGADLIPELRRRGIRTVVLSGEGGRSVAGAHVTLAKPVETSVLIAAVTGVDPP
jgi:CheY-like chemotaxis protein